MRIVNLNPDDAIGATSWFVEIEGHRLLMDAGTHPKLEGRGGLPLYDLVKDEDVDAIAISHCHHDHVGSLPVALRYFPQAHVLMTELSYFLVERVLHNSVNVMVRQRDELGIREYPLYSHDEVDDIAPRFQGFKYNREIDWAAIRKTRAGFLSPTLEFYDAGHALGSAGIMVRAQKETLFYTGDVSFHDQTILRAARFGDIKADVLVMETTRGNREQRPGFTRAQEITRLSDSIERVLARKGSILIPAFALGRTQEILALLALMMNEGRLRPQPIYIGGLGRVFTEIYDLESHRSNRQYPNLQLREALNLVVLDQNQSESMKLAGGRLFVITAGMMSENTAAYRLGLRMLGEEQHAIFFVGYADPDSPGGRLKASKPGEPFIFSPAAGTVTRRCEVEDFDLTAHANREELLDFVGEVEPRTILLAHGEEESRQWFEARIRERHPRIRVIAPKPGESVEV
jgi:Cft2 family RNA processing exonuclease